MLTEAVSVLRTVVETLDARLLSSPERSRLLSDAVDVASVAAWSAALDSSARLDRPIAGNKPIEALDKLSVAIPALGDSAPAKWATFLEAEAYAAMNRPRECFEALERSDRMAVTDDGAGVLLVRRTPSGLEHDGLVR